MFEGSFCLPASISRTVILIFHRRVDQIIGNSVSHSFVNICFIIMCFVWFYSCFVYCNLNNYWRGVMSSNACFVFQGQFLFNVSLGLRFHFSGLFLFPKLYIHCELFQMFDFWLIYFCTCSFFQKAGVRKEDVVVLHND